MNSPKHRRFFIDSNVFIYAAGEDSPCKKASLAALARLGDQGGIAVANCLILEEVHYIYYRQTRKPGECIALLHDIVQGLGEVFAITPEINGLAWELFMKIPSPASSVKDYYHAASMLQNGVGNIITFDSDFDRFRMLNRCNPAVMTD